MRMLVAITTLLCVAFLFGAATSIMLTGNLVPARTRDGSCAALNTDTGKIVGSWSRGDRCAIRDWRLLHPFSG
jgi:hypothetical protein